MKKLLISIAALCCSVAMAFDGKEHPIKFVVPFAPGGGTDGAIKIYEKYINELGYKTIVDYRPGADGLVGKRDFLEKNDLSGYSILISGSVQMAFEDAFARDKGWTVDDFAAVADIVNVPSVLATSKKSGITDYRTLQSKIKSGESVAFAYGAFQGKVASQLLLNDLKSNNNQALLVPFKGAGPGLTNVLGGHADMIMVPVSMVLSMYEADKLNVVFIGGNRRFARLKDVPTAAEVGTTMTYIGAWGVVLPKNIRREVVDFYTKLFQTIAKDPRFINDLQGIDAFVVVDKMNPDGMMENYRRHMKLFEKINVR